MTDRFLPAPADIVQETRQVARFKNEYFRSGVAQNVLANLRTL